ncbi:MAG: hypothetical protein PSX37_02695 [bacterium]|nr:hypothetical protein [bacterium]
MKRRDDPSIADMNRVPIELRTPPWDPAVPVDPGWTGKDDWIEARRRWVEAGNIWPGGDIAREQQESEARGPDEIFNYSDN